MVIASYNPSQLGDVLILILNPDTEEQTVTQKGDVVKVTDANSDKVLGFNFFNISQLMPSIKDINGQVELDQTRVDQLNQALTNAGFDDQLTVDPEPKFVVGYVKSVTEHPKSDHLKITETEVDGENTLQIVSGSPNMQADIKVVVAKVGTMMPSGLIIWPGELKGVESDGMICSGRELLIPNAPQKPGALILPDDYQVGTEFDFAKAQNLFA
ncbi:YtpR family tRNA-binding protein [Lactobacillaceae bacterium Scapto_B20]